MKPVLNDTNENKKIGFISKLKSKIINVLIKIRSNFLSFFSRFKKQKIQND